MAPEGVPKDRGVKCEDRRRRQSDDETFKRDAVQFAFEEQHSFIRPQRQAMKASRTAGLARQVRDGFAVIRRAGHGRGTAR